MRYCQYEDGDEPEVKAKIVQYPAVRLFHIQEPYDINNTKTRLCIRSSRMKAVYIYDEEYDNHLLGRLAKDGEVHIPAYNTSAYPDGKLSNESKVFLFLIEVLRHPRGLISKGMGLMLLQFPGSKDCYLCVGLWTQEIDRSGLPDGDIPTFSSSPGVKIKRAKIV